MKNLDVTMINYANIMKISEIAITKYPSGGVLVVLTGKNEEVYTYDSTSGTLNYLDPSPTMLTDGSTGDIRLNHITALQFFDNAARSLELDELSMSGKQIQFNLTIKYGPHDIKQSIELEVKLGHLKQVMTYDFLADEINSNCVKRENLLDITRITNEFIELTLEWLHQ